MISLNVGGILLSSISITDQHRELIANSPIPLVVMAQEFDAGISVVDDDYQAGFEMGKYVGKSHPEHVVWLGITDTDRAVGIVRRQGVLDGLKSCGVSDIRLFSGDYSYESGQKMAKEALENGPVTAMICATDRLAFGAYHTLAQFGKRIPDDVSVAGFGGYDESELLSPELTTLKFDSYALGQLSAETILRLIRNEPVPVKQVIGFQLISGKSVK